MSDLEVIKLALLHPKDWEKPNFNDLEKVHCWRRYVSEDLAGRWLHISLELRVSLSSCFQEIADREEWN